MLCAIFLAGCDAEPDDERLATSRRALESIAATVSAGSGGLQVKRKSEAFWEQAAVGTPFLAGDWLQTGGGAFARVEFLRGGRLEVDERALVVIDERSLDSGGAREPMLSVESGVIRGTLKNPAQTVAVRGADGTTARLAPSGGAPVEYRLTRLAQATEVAIRKGEATITAKSGKREVRAGQAVDVARETLSPVVELLPAPRPMLPVDDAQLVLAEGDPARLAWKAVPGASGYVLQLSRSQAFEQVEVSVDVANDTSVFRPGTPGTYYWRLASKSADGRHGLRGAARSFTVHRPGTRDLLAEPSDGAKLKLGKKPVAVTFRWGDSPTAAAYRLVISRDTLEGPPVVDELTTFQDASVTLTAGVYAWGVYGVGEDGRPVPLFVRPRTLMVLDGAPDVRVPHAITNWGE